MPVHNCIINNVEDGLLQLEPVSFISLMRGLAVKGSVKSVADKTWHLAVTPHIEVLKLTPVCDWLRR